MNKFKIGDKVKRLINFCDKSQGYFIGFIIEKYSEPIQKCGNIILGPYPELYKVKWNNSIIEKGFLPHGLEKR